MAKYVNFRRMIKIHAKMMCTLTINFFKKYNEKYLL